MPVLISGECEAQMVAIVPLLVMLLLLLLMVS